MKKRLGEYIPVLYRFFEENNIADDDVKTDLFNKFEKLYAQYTPNSWKAETHDYLRMALNTVYRNYLINKRKHNVVKKRVLKLWYPLVTGKHMKDCLTDDITIDLTVLNDIQSKVVRLYLENWKVKAIAEELNIKEENIRQIYSRAVKKLREVYNENKQLL